jgi:hypothetical protein
MNRARTLAMAIAGIALLSPLQASSEPFSECAHQTNLDKKIASCSQASKLTSYPWILQWVYRELARAHRERGEVEKAIANYAQSLAAEERDEVRKELHELNLITHVSRAQSLQPIPAPASVWRDYVTVVTMAPDGSWGVSTELTVGRAIVGAIRRCRAMTKAELGCGAQFRSIRDGWIVAYRCGDTNIITAMRALEDAVQAAHERESELRAFYVPNLPPCRQVLTVDPRGEVTAIESPYFGSAATD